jgi:hypothetical protein
VMGSTTLAIKTGATEHIGLARPIVELDTTFLPKWHLDATFLPNWHLDATTVICLGGMFDGWRCRI